MGRGCKALCHRSILSHVWVAVCLCSMFASVCLAVVSLTMGCAFASWAHVHMPVVVMSHFQVPCTALALAVLHLGQVLGPVL